MDDQDMKIADAIASEWDGGKARAFTALLPYVWHLGNCAAGDPRPASARVNPTDDRCTCGLRQVWLIRETPE